MLGRIENPLLQPKYAAFGNDTSLPSDVNNYYKTLKGNRVNALNPSLQYPPTTRLPDTMTKMGESQNKNPEQLPASLVGIKFPQYSSSSHALIENQREGVRLGAPDIYRDTPYQDWTYGVQYYKIFTGHNPKTDITPVIYPQAYRKSEWAQDTVDFPQVNRNYTQDITDLDMDYSCKGCNIASASLGAPVMYEPRNPNAPLPVAAYVGEYPNIGYYTAKELGTNTRNFPPPQNPIMELQRRKYLGVYTPIMPDYDNKMLRELRHGFDIV